MNDLKQYLTYLTTWIKEEVTKAHCNGVVVGLSGGIDSAVVGLLAQKAFPEQHLTVVMPCYSDQFDQECANLLINTHQLKHQIVDLSLTYDQLVATLALPQHQLALANIKPRLRMTTLYALAQSHNYLVLGTDNADEWHVGYFTKYGDGGVDLVPLIHLVKGEVQQAAHLLGVPSEIIMRPPTAGLWTAQTDEQELGVSYQQLDFYLQGKQVPVAVAQRIEHLHQVSEHKRQLAKAPPVAFSSLINEFKK
ncbi:NAD(+) synthase [Spiroplasma sp. SV19]|uniref:NAD(+) synthase n=1 Tax=Spiroplasma sp. SV19 TaxID=2570468 RepID=UPI0024B6ED90|nr:NAD(+) synthase [Spiroplasma sp. SV19]WHQ36466.1 NAD(+) synthase [Spiroplasma sp. SV19]